MKPIKPALLATAAFISLLSLSPADIFAAPVNTYGDVKVNGLLETTLGIKFPDGSTLDTSGLNGLLFNVGLVVDNSGSNVGNINSGAIKFGSFLGGVGIGSQQTSGANQYGLNFYTNSTSRLSILNNGFVGIGTAIPLYPLDVAGDINLTGNLLLPATTATAGIIKSGSNTLLHTFGTYMGADAENLFVGLKAGNFSTSGARNTGIGYMALQLISYGLDNTAVGSSSLAKNNSGGGNTATGSSSLANNETGGANTANGTYSLQNNTAGNYNTAIGLSSLINNISGSRNTASGNYSLFYNTLGNDNTAIGYDAGKTQVVANANIAGSNNTFIGAYSGPGTPNQLTYATAIGANALVSQSNSLVLGAPGVKVGIGTMAPDSAFYVTTASSSPVRIGDTGCISPTAGFAGIGLFGVMSGCFNYAILGETGARPNLYLNRPSGGDINFRMNNNQQMVLDHFGGLHLDAHGDNDGVFNHTSTTGAGLAFGAGSGEGIASKRSATGNQYGLDFYTSFLPRLAITSGGNVAIGKPLPDARLDVSGAAISILGTTSSTSFPAGQFVSAGPGTALSAKVNGTEVALVDSTGIHAGPGMTGTPIAYGSFDAAGAMLKGSNLNCTLSGTIYNCAISGEVYSSTNFVSIATVSNGTPHFCSTDWDKNSKLQVRIHSLPSGATVAAPFHLVVYKP